MIPIAEKLKNTEPTLVDPDATKLMRTLLDRIQQGEYKLYSSHMINDDHIDWYSGFIEKFLNLCAYVGDPTGYRLPTYDPYEIAYTDAQSNEEDGPILQWIGLWTNCFVIYAEFPDHPEQNGMTFAVDNESFLKYLDKGKK